MDRGHDGPGQWTFYQRELFNRLGWFIGLRWGIVSACLLAGGYEWLRHGAHDLFFVFVSLGFSIAVLNFCFWLFYRAAFGRVSSRGVFFAAWVQMVVDLICLSVLVYFSGGVKSVFVVFYMAHIVIACELLRRWEAFAMAFLTCLMFDMVAYVEAAGVLPMHFQLGYTHGSTAHSLAYGQLAAIYNLAFLFITYLASSISGRLRFREEQLEGANAELNQVNCVKSDFMRTASHELRTPLTACRAMMSFLKKKGESQEWDVDAMRYIERCDYRLCRMNSLVDDLLDYAHLQSPRGEDVSVFDLGALVSTIAEDHQPLAKDKEIELEWRAEKVLFWGYCEQMEILLKNLITNAIRYTDVNGRITVDMEVGDASVVLSVTDTGIGISPEQTQHIFKEFYRTEEARECAMGGSGLGLALCAKIVDAHRGGLTVASAPGKGSTFRVELPFAHPGEGGDGG